MKPGIKDYLITKDGKRTGTGLYSCCSANELVVRAAMEYAKDTHTPVLIEATANQVDQYGGYTGKTPSAFMEFIQGIADECGLDREQLFLGGDHLGPLTFRRLPEKDAMEEAKTLIKHYVSAGFCKIHIDTSMTLADDSLDVPFQDEVIARRGAELCRAAEDAYRELSQSVPDAPKPVYIVGSEVPTPGGSVHEEEGIRITRKRAVQHTLDSFRSAFETLCLQDAWQRVIAVVVQPGVEFGDDQVTDYDHDQAIELLSFLDENPGLVFEAHSTDYQTGCNLKQLVADGFGILKVGPALTFALREALFALDHIDRELSGVYGFERARFRDTLEQQMDADKKYWLQYYHGSEGEIALKRAFSYSDRCRYYLPNRDVQNSQELLFHHLSEHRIPLSLLKQYLPAEYDGIREGRLENTPLDLVKQHIKRVIGLYAAAAFGKDTAG